MEQWGAISFNQAYMQDYHPDNKEDRRRNYKLITHEIAHMWFGNLVTIDWWEFLWLKEGFARYLEFKSLETIKPKYHYQTDFFCDVVYLAFVNDCNNPRPVETQITHPDILFNIFDSIVYDKGATLIKMMEDIVGEEEFLKIMKLYLQRYKFQAAHSDMFFEVLQEAVPSLEGVMQPWFREQGFPIIKVKKISDKAYQLSQAEFKYKKGFEWTIPIKYYTDDMQVHSYCLRGRKVLVELDKESEWIKLNVNSRGYYFVKYDPPTMQGILSAVKGLSVLDKAGLLNTYYVLLAMYRTSIPEIVELILHIMPDYSRCVIYILNMILLVLMNRGLKKEPGFAHFCEKISLPLWHEIGCDISNRDMDAQYSATAIYWYLIVISKNLEASHAIYNAYADGTLPKPLHRFANYSLVNINPEDLFEKAKTNQSLAKRIIQNSQDQALIQKVLEHYASQIAAGEDSFLKSYNKKSYAFAGFYAMLNVLDGCEDAQFLCKILDCLYSVSDCNDEMANAYNEKVESLKNKWIEDETVSGHLIRLGEKVSSFSSSDEGIQCFDKFK